MSKEPQQLDIPEEFLKPEEDVTDSFRNYWENLHVQLAMINLLDMYLTHVGPETFDRWTQQAKDPTKVTLFLGFPLNGRIDERDDLIGTLPVNLKNIDTYRNDMMRNHCYATIVTLNTLIEAYLKHLIHEIFEKKPTLIQLVGNAKVPYSVLLSADKLKTFIDEEIY